MNASHGKIGKSRLLNTLKPPLNQTPLKLLPFPTHTDTTFWNAKWFPRSISPDWNKIRCRSPYGKFLITLIFLEEHKMSQSNNQYYLKNPKYRPVTMITTYLVTSKKKYKLGLIVYLNLSSSTSSNSFIAQTSVRESCKSNFDQWNLILSNVNSEWRVSQGSKIVKVWFDSLIKLSFFNAILSTKSW